ncbi:hypothetical protein, partial [Streptococcus gallolyticus]|uniref:hypothetical protein n=2 Tax=Streptococcus gallolyticus TaxID=315405 RepID=UPI002284075F
RTTAILVYHPRNFLSTSFFKKFSRLQFLIADKFAAQLTAIIAYHFMTYFVNIFFGIFQTLRNKNLSQCLKLTLKNADYH